MEQNNDIFRMPNWYPRFAANSLPATFVFLQEDEIEALKNGISGEPVDNLLYRLERAMDNFGYNRFVSVDTVSPTDTKRFESKRGAVRSARSAWKILCHSEKVRQAAKRGEVSAICVRPFRRMEPAREFRLFIKDGKLKGMSQYHLTRHFRRLEGVKESYWQKAEKFVRDIIWTLPVKTLVMDIYFTSDDEIFVIDLNPWGYPTEPLMLDTWERDWSNPVGIVLMPVPIPVSGNVNISF
jgi:hypothetical protein